jgi:hypothetical protein
MILATIATSIALHLGLGADGDPDMLDVMGSGDLAENNGDEEIAAAIEPDTTTAATAVQAQKPSIRKSRRVVDDWDAGEDALIAEEDALKKEASKGTGLTDDEEYSKLMNVYKAFRKLKTEFDGKFIQIFA